MTDPIARLNAADDLRHERTVALRVLKPELAAVVGGSGDAEGFSMYCMSE